MTIANSGYLTNKSVPLKELDAEANNCSYTIIETIDGK